MADPIPCLWAERGTAPIDWTAVCAELSSRDRALGAVIDQVGGAGFPPHAGASSFEALAHSIVYQQLSGKAAATIFGRMRAIYAPKRFPTPADLAATQPERLRAAGLSNAKAAAVIDLAHRTARGELPTLARIRKLTDEEIVERRGRCTC